MALTDNIRFRQGSLNALSKQAITNGSLWFTTDEGAIYLDVNGNRVRFGDFVTVANVAALPAAGHAYESALYYAKAENVLARWDKTSSKWVQLNAAGLTKVNVTGGGNVLAGATVTLDAETGAKVLTFSTASVATSEAMEGLQTRVKSLEDRMDDVEDRLDVIEGSGEGSIAKAVSDLKTELVGDAASEYNTLGKLEDKIIAAQAQADKGVADAAKVQENLDATNVRVTTAETDIKNLQAAVGEGGSVDEKIAALKKTLEDADTEIIADVEAAQKAADDAQADADQNAADIEGLTTRVAANEGDIADLQEAVDLLNADDKTEGSVDYKVAIEVAKILNDNDASDIDTLEEIAAWIKNDTAGVGSIVNRLDQVESKNESQDTAIAALQKDVTDNKAAAEKAVSDLEDALIGDAETYTDLGKAEDAIIAAKAQADKGVADAAAASAAAAKVQENLDSTNVRMTTAEGDIDSLEGRMEQAEKDIDALEKSVSDMDAAYKAADATLKSELLGDASSYTTLGKAEDAIETNATAIESINTQITAINNNLTWETFE